MTQAKQYSWLGAGPLLAAGRPQEGQPCAPPSPPILLHVVAVRQALVLALAAAEQGAQGGARGLEARLKDLQGGEARGEGRAWGVCSSRLENPSGQRSTARQQCSLSSLRRCWSCSCRRSLTPLAGGAPAQPPQRPDQPAPASLRVRLPVLHRQTRRRGEQAAAFSGPAGHPRAGAHMAAQQDRLGMHVGWGFLCGHPWQRIAAGIVSSPPSLNPRDKKQRQRWRPRSPHPASPGRPPLPRRARRACRR